MSTMPMGFGFPTPPGIPSYPGTPALNAMPGLQYNPIFDGQFAHGLTSNPYDNSLFEDLNTMQSMIYGQNGLGFPPGGPIPLQGTPMPMPPTSIPPTSFGGAPISETGATGGTAATEGSSLNQHA